MPEKRRRSIALLLASISLSALVRWLAGRVIEWIFGTR